MLLLEKIWGSTSVAGGLILLLLGIFLVVRGMVLLQELKKRRGDREVDQHKDGSVAPSYNGVLMRNWGIGVAILGIALLIPIPQESETANSLGAQPTATDNSNTPEGYSQYPTDTSQLELKDTLGN